MAEASWSSWGWILLGWEVAAEHAAAAGKTVARSSAVYPLGQEQQSGSRQQQLKQQQH